MWHQTWELQNLLRVSQEFKRKTIKVKLILLFFQWTQAAMTTSKWSKKRQKMHLKINKQLILNKIPMGKVKIRKIQRMKRKMIIPTMVKNLTPTLNQIQTIMKIRKTPKRRIIKKKKPKMMSKMFKNPISYLRKKMKLKMVKILKTDNFGQLL